MRWNGEGGGERGGEVCGRGGGESPVAPRRGAEGGGRRLVGQVEEEAIIEQHFYLNLLISPSNDVTMMSNEESLQKFKIIENHFYIRDDATFSAAPIRVRSP